MRVKVLVIIFGGIDFEYLEQFNCTTLKQQQYGRLVVDDLWKDRDVATQITSQLITGRTWRQSGVLGRKRFVMDKTERIEKRLIRNYLDSHPRFGGIEKNTRFLRRGVYALISSFGLIDDFSLSQRNYLKDDLDCETLFDVVPDSKAIYVPSYNPEPSWALDRNILDPNKFPALGEHGAVDLAEKNFNWRRQKLFDEADENYQLLVAQFQILDSFQHLYLVYSDQPQKDKVEKIYNRMDAFAGDILEVFSQYDRVLFLSDNGAANEQMDRTHYNRPFYSINDKEELDGENIRDFYHHILRWIQEEPNACQSPVIGYRQ